MKRRMAFLMSMALTVNMLSVAPVYAADEFTDTEISAPEFSTGDDGVWSDGTGVAQAGQEDVAVTDAGQELDPPAVTGSKETTGLGWSGYLVINCGDSNYVSGITQVKVGNDIWEKRNKSTFMYSGQYYKEDNKIGFDGYAGGVLKLNDIITIQSTGYKELVLKVTGEGDNFAVASVASDSGEKLTPPSVTGANVDDFNCSYSVINIAGTDYLKNITEIAVDEKKWEKTDYKIVLSSGRYLLDAENNRIMFDATSLFAGNVITIKSTGYQDLFLKVTASGTDFAVAPKDSGASDINGPSNGVTTLYVRLTGSFESALVGQKKYDAITSASTSASVNKNSNVTVEAADVPDGQEPTESDWKPLSNTVRINAQKTTANIDTENSGMEAKYSTYDSSLTLSGIPKTQGTYPVSVTVTDESGRTAQSNSLDFKVYGTEEKLIEHLKLENAVQASDGKYLYDMDPWAIPYFGGENETVTVPAEIKAWYGSHTSGTYGELGYAVRDLVPVQTLIIPAGCNLTMVNMEVLSSVKIIVEDGAKFTVRDSSIDGQIEVMNGGTLSVDYDDYNKKFLTGACINGQIILNDGAVLENAVIHSNTNYLANGEYDRHNSEPVVVVKGNATIRGEVYIRGDEAPAIGSGYSGQPALKVSNGTLNIENGALLGVYGGGQYALSYDGGDALILDNGEVSGQGTLIAVAGRGFWGNGGNGVSGNGKISVSSAYLEGGSPTSPDKNSGPGKAYSSGVDVSSVMRINAVDGRAITDPADSAPNTYWGDITEKPDTSNCTIPEMTEEQKKVQAESAVTDAVNGLTVSNATSEEDVKKVIENALEAKKQNCSDMSNITVDVAVKKEDAAVGKDGSIKITVTIKDGDKELDKIELTKTIEKLPTPSVPSEPSTPSTPSTPSNPSTPVTPTPAPTVTPTPAVPDEPEVPEEKEMIKKAYAKGNKVKVVLADECEGAQGYDYVLGTSDDMLSTKKYTKTIKNQNSLEATFEYVDKGTWYVACHSWTKGADGKKVFGQWSEVKEVKVTAVTSDAPKIEKVTVKGKNVTITYTESRNAKGYDVVLGTKYGKVNGEKRPLSYGKYVKKVGNKVTVTFKNVKKGNYYAALHAWNRTSEDNSKVFSKWSNIETVKVKK